ncbi:MAG: hypothetical protein IKD13_09695, partial [Firmicutes bacterium]|nr:hypothetical protein [Bacillota bacterium]
MKKQKKLVGRRLLALLLTLTMLLGMIPVTAFAGEASSSVTVDYTAQSAGTFLMAPQTDAEVSGDLAEGYGYTDRVTNDVSALDVLVHAHETKYGEDFTAETASQYFAIENGMITKYFGTSVTFVGVMVNGVHPHSDTKQNEDSWYYDAYGIDQAPIKSGDVVEFYQYQSSTYNDTYAWLELADGTKIDGRTVTAGQSIDIYAKGYVPFAWGVTDEEIIDGNTSAIPGVTLQLVDGTTGKITSLGVTTDAFGKASVKVPEDWNGAYYLTGSGSELIMNVAEITVKQPVAVKLTDLEIKVGGNVVSETAIQVLSPEFDENTSEYTTPILDYESDSNQRFVWVKAGIPEGATVTAKCGKSNTATLVDNEWTVLQVQGGYYWDPSYTGPLSTGKYNTVNINV